MPFFVLFAPFAVDFGVPKVAKIHLRGGSSDLSFPLVCYAGVAQW